MAVSQSQRPQRRRGFVFPVLLIVVGVLLFLNYLEVLPWDMWLDSWKFWPVVLILIGLDLALGRRANGLIVAPVLLLMGAGLIGGLVWHYWDWTAAPAGTRVVGQITQPLGTLQSARVELNFGAGELNVRSLPSSSTQLASAQFEGRGANEVRRYFDETEDGAGTLRLTGDWWRGFPFFGRDNTRRWDVALSPQVPIALDINAGASSINLDLRDLRISDLRLSVGAVGTNVTFPEKGKTRATISSGAASFDLTIPQGVAARIQHDGALNSLDVDETRFPRDGNHYQSPNYDSADDRLELTLDTSVGSVTVR
jgi:hypothetical protein